MRPSKQDDRTKVITMLTRRTALVGAAIAALLAAAPEFADSE